MLGLGCCGKLRLCSILLHIKYSVLVEVKDVDLVEHSFLWSAHFPRTVRLKDVVIPGAFAHRTGHSACHAELIAVVREILPKFDVLLFGVEVPNLNLKISSVICTSSAGNEAFVNAKLNIHLMLFGFANVLPETCPFPAQSRLIFAVCRACCRGCSGHKGG